MPKLIPQETMKIWKWLTWMWLSLEDLLYKSDILWHTWFKNKWPSEFRDKDKALIMAGQMYNVSFNAAINPNGVGDWKEPSHAITYSILCACRSSIRPYRHKNFWQTDFNKFYAYDRTVGWLLAKFQEYIELSESTWWTERVCKNFILSRNK